MQLYDFFDYLGLNTLTYYFDFQFYFVKKSIEIANVLYGITDGYIFSDDVACNGVQNVGNLATVHTT